jgi:hypothetical protein
MVIVFFISKILHSIRYLFGSMGISYRPISE